MKSSGPTFRELASSVLLRVLENSGASEGGLERKNVYLDHSSEHRQ